MPFNFRQFVRLFRRAFREASTPRRRKVVWTLFLVMPLLAAFNAVCLGLDRVLFGRFARIAVSRPVVIIGHSRSGTTLMHELLAADEQFSWFMTYELILPALVQKKLVRLLGRFDREHRGGRFERRLRAWQDRAFAAGRQMHPMDLLGPEEDEFVLAPTFYSGTVGVVFPNLEDLQPYSRFDERLDARTRRRVMAFYRACVQRQLSLNGPAKTHLSKNPMFSNKVRSLIEAFPDARFVVMVRNPYETIPSIQKMMLRNYKASGTDRAQIDAALAIVWENSIAMYRQPFEVLDAHPEVRWTAVPYELLTTDPAAAMRQVYLELGIPIGESSEHAMKAAAAHARAYKPAHDYSLAELGLSPSEIHSQLEPLFERFRWPEPTRDGGGTR
ncbi:sulfotransferase [Myxococcota bacterium]|nr:sulfotransferase [Myxococcota bacterium]